MLCKWQVKKLCIFYIQLSIRDGGGGVEGAEGLDRKFKLLLDCVIFPNWSYHFTSLLSLLSFFLFLTHYPPSPSPPSPYLFFSIIIFIIIYSISSSHTWTRISSLCFAWTWPQFVNILPLAHPLCWYNDHLTVKSKARRKLGRRRQRGQQHWSNYVSFSPSILTLMKSLIVRGKRKVGRGGQVHEMYVVHLSYSLKWTEGAARIM